MQDSVLLQLHDNEECTYVKWVLLLEATTHDLTTLYKDKTKGKDSLFAGSHGTNMHQEQVDHKGFVL